MKLVSIENAEDALVYDLEVENEHNFFANGVCVHNCTGLEIPTIAVATDGGVSVIKDDGSVADWLTSHGVIYNVSISSDGAITASGGGGIYYYTWFRDSIPTTDTNTFDRTLDATSTPKGAFNLYNGGDHNRKDTRLNKDTYAFASTGTTGRALTLLKENRASPVKGMVNYITDRYQSGWQHGDIKGAWLADSTAETLAGAELVTNGNFDTDASGWLGVDAALSLNSNRLVITNTSSYGYAYQAVTTTVGKPYTVSATYDLNSSATRCVLGIGTTPTNAQNGVTASTIETNASGVLAVSFVATTTTTYIALGVDAGASTNQFVDNISLKLADPDRSYNNNGLQVNGSITKSAVATGTELMAYSGFSSSNYLQQPYSSSLDFGTGDFYVMGWVKNTSATNQVFLAVGDTEGRIILQNSGTDYRFWPSTVAANYYISGGGNPLNTWVFIAAWRSGTSVYLSVNGTVVASGTSAHNATGVTPVLDIGYSTYVAGAPASNMSLCLFRIGAGAPSDAQIKEIYESEKHLFQENAACTLAGTSSYIKALAYDEITKELHVCSTTDRSVFQGLTRTASENVAYTSYSAHNGLTVGGN